MDEFPFVEDAQLDHALNQLPLAPLPSGFVQQVMTRVPQSAEPVRFQLEFFDWAIPLFTAVFTLILILLFGGQLPGGMPPISLNLAQFTRSLTTNWQTLWVAALFMEVYIGAIVGFWLWSDRSLPVIRHP
jgi:hypothetical protein